MGRDDARDLILALRGCAGKDGQVCDFCQRYTPMDLLEPEEAGAWVCDDCRRRWEENESER